MADASGLRGDVNMRLNQHEIDIIRREVAALMGADAEVRLFGSRVHDAQRGGDIDLWVSLPAVADNRALLAARLIARLQLALGDQRIDVRVVDPLTLPAPVDEVAMTQGVRL